MTLIAIADHNPCANVVHVLHAASNVGSQSSRSVRNEFRLFVSGKWFALCWWLVFVFRAASIAFLSAMTWLYYWLLHTPAVQPSTLGELSFHLSYAALGVVNLGFAILNLLQIFMLGKSVFYSLKTRQLAFSDSASLAQQRSKRFWLVRAAGKVKKRWIEPFLFIHGPYFDYYFVLRECLETVSQIYQGYQMSVYIATRWINDLFVIMLFLNCVSTPLIHHSIPSTHVPLRRLLSVICSAFLNFVNSLVIPVIIFAPYAAAYNTQRFEFDRRLLLDDVWYARAIRENQQLFVTSYVDFWTSWMLHWNLFSCLFTCEDLIRRVGVTSAGPARTSVAPATKAMIVSKMTTKQHTSTKPQMTRTHERILYNLLWITGVAVLCIHIVAQSPHAVPGCTLNSTPWFASKSSCIIMNINCFRRQILGHEQEMNEILELLSASTLFQLIFSHCPALQVPPLVREFCHLGGLDIYNCTLDAWPASASLRQESHPNINYIFVFRSRLAGIPEGLMDRQFPEHLNVIYFYDTNVTTLPDELVHSWSSTELSIGFEFGRLERFPTFLANNQLQAFALTGNPLGSTPPDSVVLSKTLLAYLSNTTLNGLPNETLVGDLDQLMVLQLEFTQVNEIPSSIHQWYSNQTEKLGEDLVVHSLFGSPFCNRNLLPHEEDQRDYQTQVCSTNYLSAEGYYNSFDLEQLDRQRQL